MGRGETANSEMLHSEIERSALDFIGSAREDALFKLQRFERDEGARPDGAIRALAALLADADVRMLLNDQSGERQLKQLRDYLIARALQLRQLDGARDFWGRIEDEFSEWLRSLALDSTHTPLVLCDSEGTLHLREEAEHNDTLCGLEIVKGDGWVTYCERGRFAGAPSCCPQCLHEFAMVGQGPLVKAALERHPVEFASNFEREQILTLSSEVALDGLRQLLQEESEPAALQAQIQRLIFRDIEQAVRSNTRRLVAERFLVLSKQQLLESLFAADPDVGHIDRDRAGLAALKQALTEAYGAPFSTLGQRLPWPSKAEQLSDEVLAVAAERRPPALRQLRVLISLIGAYWPKTIAKVEPEAFPSMADASVIWRLYPQAAAFLD